MNFITLHIDSPFGALKLHGEYVTLNSERMKINELPAEIFVWLLTNDHIAAV